VATGSDPYKWTRWAAGNGGQTVASWLGLIVGLAGAIWVFRVVPHWYLAVPAAIIAWLVVTAVMGGFWALVRVIIERLEGIRW
jgi:hypothetical protein